MIAVCNASGSEAGNNDSTSASANFVFYINVPSSTTRLIGIGVALFI
jgi:hypothetical protein